MASIYFNEEHEALREMTRRFIESEINPHVEKWEEERIFPAHELFKKLGDVGSDMVGLQCEAHIGVTNSAGDMIGLRLPTAPLVLLGDRVLPKNPNPTLRDQFLRSTLKSTVMMIGYSCTAIGEGQEHPETNLCRGGEAGVQFTYLFGNDGDKVYDDVTINFKNLSVAFLYHQDRIASIGDALNPSLTAKCVYSPDREANCFSQGNCLSTRKLFNPDEEGLKQFCEAKLP